MESTENMDGTSSAPFPKEPHPVTMVVPVPEKSSRILALATILIIPKAILLIPHFIALYFLGIVAFVVAFIAQIAVLFTGKYPRPLFRFVHWVLQWQLRINVYFLGLSDIYPPFTLPEDK